MNKVLCILPKAGLGNQLFPLLRAAVFAKLHGLPLTVTGYRQTRIGPWLRGEKNKRSYRHLFDFERPLLTAWVEQRRVGMSLKKNTVVKEPGMGYAVKQQEQYLFAGMPHWEDYFGDLKTHREMVKECLYEMLDPGVLKELYPQQPPCIGVHIRRGDFRKLKAGEDFATVGTVRTPEDYFIDVITGLRKINGSDLPVKIFTDGYAKELKRILALEQVEMVEGNNDMVDLLLLSRSKVVITSAGSTFSYWAAFLADAPVIMHPDHIHQPLRPNLVNAQWYEGAMDEGSALLVRNIKDISWGH
jgi:hypothetical protein